MADFDAHEHFPDFCASERSEDDIRASIRAEEQLDALLCATGR